MDLINESVLTTLVNTRVEEIMKEKNYEPRTAGLTQQIRKDYFHGKGTEWIRAFIFDRYPEVDEKHGGWCVNPRRTKKGSKTMIWLKPCREWLDNHELEIDWNEKLPK